VSVPCAPPWRTACSDSCIARSDRGLRSVPTTSAYGSNEGSIRGGGCIWPKPLAKLVKINDTSNPGWSNCSVLFYTQFAILERRPAFLTEGLGSFPQSLRRNAELVVLNRPRLLPSVLFNIIPSNKNKTNSVALGPRANYIDWAIATCWRNLVRTFADRWVSRGQRSGSPTVVILSFLDQSRYFSFK
jgi:hypothetical protein